MICNIKDIVVGGDKGVIFVSRISAGVAYDHNDQVIPKRYFKNMPNILNIDFVKSDNYPQPTHI